MAPPDAVGVKIRCRNRNTAQWLKPGFNENLSQNAEVDVYEADRRPAKLNRWGKPL
jgi:hypothetical protein